MTTRSDFRRARRAMRVFGAHRIAGTSLLKRCAKEVSSEAFAAAARSFASRLEHAFGPECVRVAGREGRSRSKALALNLKSARYRRDARKAGGSCRLDSTPGLRLVGVGVGP